MKIRTALGLMMAGLTSVSAFGWGQKGHDVVAFIAESHMTPATKATVDSLLQGRSIVYWANWLDNASHTPEYAYTKTWHYRNIDAGQDYDKAPRHTAGDVVNAIESQVYLLSDPDASPVSKTLALKILVHLMGDLHQPMHMGHKSDLGGNKVKVKYFNADRNLHGIWDSNLVESAHKWSYSEWKDQIDRAAPQEEAVIITGNPDSWGRETYSIATAIYDQTPEDYNVSYDYIAKWAPVIEDQLLKGGLRLADVLNGLFDPDYSKANDIKTKSK